MHLSGADNVINLLDIPPAQWNFKLVEPLFCEGGCINGPGIATDKNIFLRKQDVISYTEKSAARQDDIDRSVNTGTGYRDDRASLLTEGRRRE